MSELALVFQDVQKAYGGLRPLRVKGFELAAGQTVALVGFDQATAELFVNLATGAVLPDQGEVRVFGTSTAAIADPHAWLASLDRFGIVSERAVLLDGLTALQNLAMPMTLEVDPLSDSVRDDVARLAAEVGLDGGDLPRPVGALSPASRLRVRVARALALNPQVLLAEHPNASLPPAEVPAFAADYARVTATRRLASVTLTADTRFAAAVAAQVLTLQPATGELKLAPGWRRWFTGR